MSIIDLSIGIPAYGGRVSAEHTRMFLSIGHALACSEARFNFKSWSYVDTCGIDKARNELLQSARGVGASWLLMIDTDTWIIDDGEDTTGFQLLRMISEADRLGASVVGAPVMRRRAQGDKREVMAYVYDDRAISRFAPAQKMLVPYDRIPEQLVECDALATAVFAVNLAKTEGLTFTFTDLSEDLDFCRQVKQRDGKILVDGRVHTAHLSRPYPITYPR